MPSVGSPPPPPKLPTPRPPAIARRHPTWWRCRRRQPGSPIARRIARRVRSSAPASPIRRPATLPPDARLCSSNATSAGLTVPGQIAGCPCVARLGLEHGEPAADGVRDVVVERPGPRVVLDRRGGDEASAGEHPRPEMLDPGIDHGLEPREPALNPLGRPPDRIGEPLDRCLQHRSLHRLLVAEAADQTALAHPELAGQPPDRDALESLDRSEVDGRLDRRGTTVGDVGGGAAGHFGSEVYSTNDRAV